MAIIVNNKLYQYHYLTLDRHCLFFFFFCPQLGFQAFTLTSALGIGLVNAWERFGNVLLNNSLANTPNGTMFVQTFNDEVLRLLQGFTGMWCSVW